MTTTPRKTRRRLFRDGTLVVVPMRDTELQAELEAEPQAFAPTQPQTPRYRIGKPEQPERKSWTTHSEAMGTLLYVLCLAVAAVCGWLMFFGYITSPLWRTVS